MNKQIEEIRKDNKKRKYKPLIKEGRKNTRKKAQKEKYTDEPIDSDDDTEWVVEYILDIREKEGQIQYLVKWRRCEADEATWEAWENCVNAKNKVKDFHQDKGLDCPDCDYLEPTTRAVRMHKTKTGHGRQ